MAIDYKEHPRVLFFTTIMSWEGGACRAFRETVKRVAARGVQPLVVVPECADSLEMFPKANFDVVYLKLQRPRRTWNAWIQGKYLVSFPSTFLSLRRLIRQRRIDLVHFNELMDFVAGMAARSCGVPCVCHVRAHRLPNPYRWTLLSALRATVDAIVVPSRYTAAWIKAEDAKLAERVRLIHDYAWDVNESEPDASGAEFRRELGLTSDQVLVTLVSKLTPPKGHECFIRAAEKVLKVSHDIRFVVIGGPVAGHERAADEIRALGEKLAPVPALRFVGPRFDLPSVYAASDIVVHCPIFPDTYPTVVLLPMFAGKPVIGSDIGGIPEQIEHNKTGVLVPRNDPAALAGAILRLAHDPSTRESIGSAAQKAIRESWRPEKQGRLLAKLYSEVIQRRVPHREGGSRAERTPSFESKTSHASSALPPRQRKKVARPLP
jgi:glycosyltransferase involved in cell wall biosynthesis